MKKVILSLLFIAAGMTAFADPSARVKISLGTTSATVREDVTEEKFEAFGSPVIVLNIGGTRYSQVKLNDIEGLALDYLPKAESFNFTFANVIGDLYLVDLVNGTRTAIVDGGTYPVTATAAEVAAGAYISGRYAISKIEKQNLCFNYNKLQLTLYKGEKVEIYEAGATTPTISKDVTSDVFEIDLSDKTKGMYKVKLVNANKEYFIDVKPDVTVVP